jgi:hypothetical protein
MLVTAAIRLPCGRAPKTLQVDTTLEQFESKARMDVGSNARPCNANMVRRVMTDSGILRGGWGVDHHG